MTVTSPVLNVQGFFSFGVDKWNPGNDYYYSQPCHLQITTNVGTYTLPDGLYWYDSGSGLNQAYNYLQVGDGDYTEILYYPGYTNSQYNPSTKILTMLGAQFKFEGDTKSVIKSFALKAPNNQVLISSNIDTQEFTSRQDYPSYSISKSGNDYVYMVTFSSWCDD